MSCTNFQRTISLHKNVKYQSVILTIIEGDFQLVFENIELDTLQYYPTIAIGKFTNCTTLLHENAQFCSDKKCLI